MPDKEKKKVDAEHALTAPEHVENPGFPGLRAIPSVSVLGPDHNGILDDDLFEMLEASVNAKDATTPNGSSNG
tara:strand:+ start:1346 stop:1564 length:219 start_codon:yes stop_codon:yes gene_type:complete